MTQRFKEEDLVYVRPNVVLEPLINHYYAWLNLVSPLTAAMNFTKMHGPLLRSFLEAPDTHRDSARDPRLRGGMFVDVGDRYHDQVADLIKTLNGGPMPLLSAAADELGGSLERNASGFDLTSLYRDVPEPLKGFVELVYDLNDHARVRYCEPLLYASPYFDIAAQSIDLSLCTSDQRPFAMATPRFASRSHLQTQMPLSDSRVDLFFTAMSTPRPYAELRAALEVRTEEDLATFESFLDRTTGMCPDRGGDESRLRVRYFGHACVVVQAGSTTVMTDPFLANKLGDDRYSYADLPDHIDYVVITHGHQDHLEFGTLLKLRHKIGTIIVPKTSGGALQDPSPRLSLKALGFTKVIDVEPGDVIDLPSGRIVVCPFIGEHCDLDIAAKVTYAVQSHGKTLYFGADNRGLDRTLFRNIRDLIGDVDYAFLGMECDGAPLTWIYGPLFSRAVDRAKSTGRKLNGSNAIEAMGIVRALRARNSYVYAMGREPWLEFVMATNYTEDSYQIQQMTDFFERCSAVAINASELYGRAEIL